MSIPVAARNTRTARVLVGIAAAALCSILLEGLSAFATPVPSPAVILLLVIIYCRYTQRLEGGIASAVSGFSYCLYLSLMRPERLANHNGNALLALIPIALSFFGAVALLHLLLKKPASGLHEIIWPASADIPD